MTRADRDGQTPCPSTLAELLAGAEGRKAEPVRPDTREELEARLAELRRRAAR